MKRFVEQVRRFLIDQDGPTTVEYAVLLALIVVVSLVAIEAVGTRSSATFNNVANHMPTS
jgi:pilus assembly protein Flp/PilA